MSDLSISLKVYEKEVEGLSIDCLIPTLDNDNRMPTKEEFLSRCASAADTAWHHLEHLMSVTPDSPTDSTLWANQELEMRRKYPEKTAEGIEADLKKKAARWDAIETLMMIGNVELNHAPDGGYDIVVEPAENIEAHSWSGNTPDEVADRVVGVQQEENGDVSTSNSA